MRGLVRGSGGAGDWRRSVPKMQSNPFCCDEGSHTCIAPYAFAPCLLPPCSHVRVPRPAGTHQAVLCASRCTKTDTAVVSTTTTAVASTTTPLLLKARYVRVTLPRLLPQGRIGRGFLDNPTPQLLTYDTDVLWLSAAVLPVDISTMAGERFEPQLTGEQVG